jgi:hypothetical protein
MRDATPRPLTAPFTSAELGSGTGNFAVRTPVTLTAYRYKVYDITIDDYRYSTRMATRGHIARIGGVLIEGSEIELDDSLLLEGWTEKNFDPAK